MNRIRTLTLAAACALGCAADPEGSNDTPSITAGDSAELSRAEPEDGLSDAFTTFVNLFSNGSMSSLYRVSLGFHPGLSTERLVGREGVVASGQAVLNMNSGQVTATLSNVPRGANFELWLVKNAPGGTVAPEAADEMLKVGKFSAKGATRTLDAAIGFDVLFDLDLVIVTRAGKKPTESRIAVGARTLFEKRALRFRQREALDPVTGTQANNVETTDPLVARGAHLFFNETFGGNGRTCGTCHRAENNLTIDPAFIATLPQSDPLFVAENNPALAKLENPALLRTRGLILENVDGFDDPTRKFVMRSVPHTFSLGLTLGLPNARLEGAPPDQSLGWSGDGGPGRSALHDFSFGAIVQHFPKTLERKPGVDFRVPTQEELDALEAFQLFTGRQKPVNFFAAAATDSHALNGQSLFFSTGCSNCHKDLLGNVDLNLNNDTGVSNLTPDLPGDDGFLTPGDGTFNAPPLAEAADTAPFFHNNALDTIEAAVSFYFTQTFRDSPSSFLISQELSADQQADLAAFLRVINASTNIDQVRKRVGYVQNVRSPGNTELLELALFDLDDARDVLADKALNPDTQALLTSAEQKLKGALNDKDRDRPSPLGKVLALLDKAKATLFSAPPDGDGGGEGELE
jgi:cytochrome c peroxidase